MSNWEAMPVKTGAWRFYSDGLLVVVQNDDMHWDWYVISQESKQVAQFVFDVPAEDRGTETTQEQAQQAAEQRALSR